MPRDHNIRCTCCEPRTYWGYCCDKRSQIPCRYYCYIFYLLIELLTFEFVCIFLIIDRFTNALQTPYDPFVSGDLVLFIVVLMAMQAFIFVYSICSLAGENGVLLVFGFFAQVTLIVRCALFFGNFFEWVYITPLIFQLIFLPFHNLCGYWSELKYGFRKFETVNSPIERKRYKNWKCIEALLYFDMLTSFCVIVLGLGMIDYSPQFFIYGIGYLFVSLFLIPYYINKCYHEQWKCCTIIYIFFQFNLVLYIAYKSITVISGMQSDELSPTWDDNDLWHLVWVFVNLGSSASSAFVIRAVSFLWLIYTIAFYFDKKLTVALKHRPPRPGPHYMCMACCLYSFHMFVVKIWEKICCKKCKCSCCGIRELEGWFGVKEFIRDLRAAKTLEDELEQLGENAEREKESCTEDPLCWGTDRCRDMICISCKACETRCWRKDDDDDHSSSDEDDDHDGFYKEMDLHLDGLYEDDIDKKIEEEEDEMRELKEEDLLISSSGQEDLDNKSNNNNNTDGKLDDSVLLKDTRTMMELLKDTMIENYKKHISQRIKGWMSKKKDEDEEEEEEDSEDDSDDSDDSYHSKMKKKKKKEEEEELANQEKKPPATLVLRKKFVVYSQQEMPIVSFGFKMYNKIKKKKEKEEEEEEEEDGEKKKKKEEEEEDGEEGEEEKKGFIKKGWEGVKGLTNILKKKKQNDEEVDVEEDGGGGNAEV